jgi:hypothetical protein
VAVIDSEGGFLGLVSPHRMLRVLLTKHEEDLARLGGFWHGPSAPAAQRRKRGARPVATPVFLVVLTIGSTDILFALDSIRAVFGVTEEPFIVFTANAFALLGLRALFLSRHGSARPACLPLDRASAQLLSVCVAAGRWTGFFRTAKLNGGGIVFKTIVLALDGSENSQRATPVAVELAKQNGGKIVIAHVEERIAAKGGADLYAR